MNVIYPAICHYEDGGYWSEFPDLDGCFSQGDTEREIIENSRESLEGYILTLLERGIELPKASTIRGLKTARNDFTTYIECPVSSGTTYIRKSVTVPEWLCVKAEKMGINFSRTLQEALFQKIRTGAGGGEMSLKD
ncbi:MAG: type II toxin-antitoxin system HicB family antitoxin [Treponema sp.]